MRRKLKINKTSREDFFKINEDKESLKYAAIFNVREDAFNDMINNKK